MAATTDMQARFSDPEYKNWLKVGQALLCLRDGLCSFTDSLSKDLHRDVLQQSGVGTKSCTQCSAKKDIQYQSKSNGNYWVLKNPCPVNVCDKLLPEVAKQHATVSAKQQVYWGNTNMSKWTSDHWEIAKVYMGKGQKPDNTRPSKTDASNLLNLIKTCKFFKSHVSSLVHIKKVSEFRNKVMHSSSLRMDEQMMKSAIAEMVAVLEDPTELKDNSDAKTAVRDIREIEQMDIDPLSDNDGWKDKEVVLLKEKFSEFEDRLSNLEDDRDRTEECNMLQEFLDKNPDLKASVELNQRVDSLQTQIDKLSARVGQTAIGKVSAGFDYESNYKQKLNHIGQKRNYSVEYHLKSDPANSKWFASVTVNGKTYHSEKSFSSGGKAEQNAAFQALQELEELESPGKRTGAGETAVEKSVKAVDKQPATSPTATSTKKKKGASTTETQDERELNSLLCRLGFQKCSRDTVCEGDKVKAVLRVKVSHCVGLEESVSGKKNAEQKVAEKILQLLSIPCTESNKSKDQLYAFCGKSQKKPPNYFCCKDKNKDQYFWAYATLECLGGEIRTVSVEGTLCQNDTEAVQSAAQAMLEILNGVKLELVLGANNKGAGQGQNSTSNSTCGDTPNSSNSSAGQASAVKSLSSSNSSSNSAAELNEYCQKNGLERPTIDALVGEENGRKFKGIIKDFPVKFSIACGGPSSKKEAKKKLARHALKVVFNKECENESGSINSLQEACVKHLPNNTPNYTTPEGHIEVTFKYKVEGSEWFSDKKTAKSEVACKVLIILKNRECSS